MFVERCPYSAASEQLGICSSFPSVVLVFVLTVMIEDYP